MRNVSNTLRNVGFVNDYCIRQKPNSDKATVIVYLSPNVCSNDDKRQEAISNLANKIDDLSDVDVATDEFSDRYSTQVGIRRQQRGIMGSISVECT